MEAYWKLCGFKIHGVFKVSHSEVHSLLFGAHMEMVKLGRPLNRASFRSYLPTASSAELQLGQFEVRELAQLACVVAG